MAHEEHSAVSLDSLHQSGLFVQIVGEALPLVDCHFVVEGGGLLGERDEALVQAGDGNRGGGVKVDDDVDVRACVVDCGMDDVGSDVGGGLVEVVRGDLVEEESTRGDEETAVLETGAHVVPHQLIHAELSGDVVGSGEIRPFLSLICVVGFACRDAPPLENTPVNLSHSLGEVVAIGLEKIEINALAGLGIGEESVDLFEHQLEGTLDIEGQILEAHLTPPCLREGLADLRGSQPIGHHVRLTEGLQLLLGHTGCLTLHEVGKHQPPPIFCHTECLCEGGIFRERMDKRVLGEAPVETRVPLRGQFHVTALAHFHSLINALFCVRSHVLGVLVLAQIQAGTRDVRKVFAN
mmetsp:Transcript_24064/g.47246  ORF Transcript_24064/g.47246 Transcript_24064/m.47246 type:complete len:351 (-) Transcript_24064:489-1541(-)